MELLLHLMEQLADFIQRGLSLFLFFLILSIKLSPVSIPLAYLAMARNEYKAKRVQQRKNLSFWKWLLTYHKQTLQTLRGGHEVKKTINGRTSTIIAKPDYTPLVPFTILAMFFGIYFFIVSLLPMMPKEESDDE